MGLGMDVACVGFEKTREIESAAAQALLKLLHFANEVTHCSLTITRSESIYLTTLEVFASKRQRVFTQKYSGDTLLPLIEQVFTETEARLSAFIFRQATTCSSAADLAGAPEYAKQGKQRDHKQD
ncbi:hypothetical protein [Paraburkholderia sp. SIMBA_027]|uniref:hypothetical protein n=1 Tax=Paraburkholderia sp. SIMBA_027 TaxID=3085770 RepID=UPI0039794497